MGHVSTFWILAFLHLLDKGQAGHSPAIGLGHDSQTQAYEFSEEEARVYWKKRGRLESTLASRTVGIGHPLKKRSAESATACEAMDYTERTQNGAFIGHHTFRWMNAFCVDPFGARHFWVHCEHTFNEMQRPYVTFIDAKAHLKECAKDEICIPWSHATYNGVEQIGPHQDIKCVPAWSVPKPIAFQSPFWDDIVHCTMDVHVPEDSGGHYHAIPPQGLTFLLTEQIEHINGMKYNASKLYIEDRSSKIFKPWRRKEVLKADIATTEISVFTNKQRAVIRFCAELAKGSAQWLILHYGAYQLNSRDGRHHRRAEGNLTVENHN